jgi:tRNA pseudouridine38-40 synthase
VPTFKATIAYDGTDFVGWQRQANGVSIQGVIESALADLDGRAVAVAGAGRTDAGVHALGQVASFSLERAIDARIVQRAVNARLPATIRVVAAEEVPPVFHARFGARSKTYRYRLINADVCTPFERAYVWQVPGALDLDAMAQAAGQLVGRHDFAAFQAGGGDTRSTVRDVIVSRIDADSERAGALISYEIEGTGFLRHMVRTIVGSLVEIGRGRRDVEWLTCALASKDRAQAGPTAPAAGLFLVRVDYAGSPLAAEP